MIHIKKLVCVCAVCFILIPQMYPVFGAFEYRGLGWPAAMANIRVVGSHPFQYALNPALIERGLPPGISLSYQKPFQGLDLQAGAISLQNRIWQRPFIHHLEFLGDELYSELKLSSGTAWLVEKGFSAGMMWNYHHLSMSGYQSEQAISISLSSAATIHDQVKIGSVLENVIQLGNELTLPQKFHLGGQYIVGPVTLILSLEKESALPVEANMGFLYASASFWEAGFGYRDLNGELSVGWRIHLQRIAFHYVLVTHPQLPVSQGFGLEMLLP